MRLSIALLLFALVAQSAHYSHLTLLDLTRPAAVPAAPRGSNRASPRNQNERSQVIPDVLPSSTALTLLSLGYKNLVADYYWLRSISDYGNKQMAYDHYPNLWPLLSRAHDLDPQFAAPYIFAGNVMTLRGMQWQSALAMLAQGAQIRPDLWRIAFLYGFNLYYMQQDFAAASRVLAQAATHPDAPTYVGPLAARLAAEAGEPEVGLAMVNTLLAEMQDPDLLAILQDRHQRLQLELDLKKLNQAVAAFRAARGVAPRQIVELEGFGGLQSVPPDPLGGAYYLDAAGVVQTRHENLRLRLSTKTKEDSRASH